MLKNSLRQATSTASVSTLVDSPLNNLSLSFTQSDTQGRSLILGEPTKITISSAIQPSVAIGVPPMHVDFISPDPVDGAPPQVMNLSAVPTGFKTTYEQDDSTGTASGATNTTSWSFGAKESVNASVKVGNPNTEGVEASDTLTAAQNLKGSAEKDYGTYQRQTYNLSQTTGFGDEVSFIDSQFNIWVYPVIGRTVCPAETPNCQNSQKVPLNDSVFGSQWRRTYSCDTGPGRSGVSTALGARQRVLLSGEFATVTEHVSEFEQAYE
jgi:hypothetical protein